MRTLKLVAVICLFAATFFSCQKDKTVADPEGTITLSMRNVGNGGTGLDFYLSDETHMGWIRIDAGNNFHQPGEYSNNHYSKIDIARVDANCLGDVTTIPSSGWASLVAVTPGDGYVVRVKGKDNTPLEGKTLYCRLYVTSWITAAGTNGIIGAEVKYQYPMPY